MNINEDRESPRTAKTNQLVCPRCSTHCEVTYPYNATEEERHQLRHDVVTEHARVCPAGPADEAVVYPILYPRK